MTKLELLGSTSLALACALALGACGEDSGGGGSSSGGGSGFGGAGGAGASGGTGAAGQAGAGGGTGGASPGFQPPLGVPLPSFGIDEKPPALPSPWSKEEPGFYYVETAGCDDARERGYPGAPRCTTPSTVPGGSLVALHGQLDSDQSFTAEGTSTQPVFVIGFDSSAPPLLTARQGVAGSYVILEQLKYGPESTSDQDFGFGASEGSDHIVLRHSELTGNLERAGGVGLGSWSYSGTETLSHVVLYDLSIHDLGTLEASWDQDAHCITVNGSVDHLWVLDSKLYKCSGDGIQLEAQTGRRDKIHHVYYGRNVSHDNRQSGGWVKHATDVVFSQNTAYNIRNNSGGPGPCFGQQYGPERVWYLFNEGHHCNIGIIVGNGDPPGDGQSTYLVGNVIHDTETENVGHPYQSGCFSLRGPGTVWVVNNTCANTDGGLYAPPGSNAVFLWNNVIRRAASTAASTWDLYTEGSVTLDVKSNIFSSSPRFTDGTEQTSCAGLASMATVSGCSAADPLFVSSTDFHLGAGSPAIDAGIVADVYATYQSTYGASIDFDRDGKPRPSGAGWDLGAYEH